MNPVYIDFDDVICETARALMVLVKERFGKRVEYDAIHYFDLSRSFSLTEEQTESLVDMFHDPVLLAGLKPVSGALAGLKRFAAAEVPIWIITGRPPGTYEASVAWLDAHGVSIDRLIIVDKYARNHAPRGDIPTLTLDEVKALDCRLAIEDSADMADFLLRNASFPVALLTRPWNRSYQPDPSHQHRFLRVADWSGIPLDGMRE